VPSLNGIAVCLLWGRGLERASFLFILAPPSWIFVSTMPTQSVRRIRRPSLTCGVEQS